MNDDTDVMRWSQLISSPWNDQMKKADASNLSKERDTQSSMFEADMHATRNRSWWRVSITKYLRGVALDSKNRHRLLHGDFHRRRVVLLALPRSLLKTSPKSHAVFWTDDNTATHSTYAISSQPHSVFFPSTHSTQLQSLIEKHTAPLHVCSYVAK